MNTLWKNPVLASITFWLVIALGAYAYLTLPREQDPSINFNWVQVMTGWPGASATDVEQRITDQLEEGIARVADIKFVSSSSREGLSSILVRFNAVDRDTFYRRVSDLRREVQDQESELPVEVNGPYLLEITSANAFPTATVLVVGQARDAMLQKFARITKADLERWPEVDRIDDFGSTEPEIRVHFSLESLTGLGANPAQIADSVKAYFQDLAAGSIGLGDQRWLVRLAGTSADPEFLSNLPLITPSGEVPLRSVSNVFAAFEDPQHLVNFSQRPAVLLSIFKADQANNLDILHKLRAYISERNKTYEESGLAIILVDDQTVATREALGIMENNALIGLALVMIVTWMFLGAKIAVFTTIGIPFVLAGTLFFLSLTGQTLNVTVLLAIVISLGMLVDDAVVVVEGIYYHLQRGLSAIDAAALAFREAVGPVTTAVMTTIAAFLPLLLLPGLLGDFMRVVPIVVITALLFSLIEAYWMLPAHVVSGRVTVNQLSRSQRARNRANRWIRRRYTHALIWTMRRSKSSLLGVLGVVTIAVALLLSGAIRMDFFASDLFRLFYINVSMPTGTSLEKTNETVKAIEELVGTRLSPSERRAVTSYAGLGFTEKEPILGHEYGQVFVTLNPADDRLRTVDEIIDDLREAVAAIPGPAKVSFMRRKTGPPTSRPISVKVRGDNFERIRQAADVLIDELQRMRGVEDVADDDVLGKMQLSVQLNPDTVTRSGLNPADVIRMVRLFTDGEVVAEMQHEGQELGVRVRADPRSFEDIDQFLSNTIPLPDGGEIALGELLRVEARQARDNIRHFDFRRAITVEADIDAAVTDTITSNRQIQAFWQDNSSRFPGITIDLSGELDDIEQGMRSLAVLFAVGVALIYLILGTQFKSYRQPLLVIVAIPLAFIGVLFGLFVTQNPLSLYTMYGVIALAGIAANDAIVLMAAANRNVASGSPRAHAITYAAKRRVIPIIITSATTIAGLFSLAAGLGGHSLIWGPVATSIVWGLAFSTVLTLFVVPLSFFAFVPIPRLADAGLAPPPALRAKPHGAPTRSIIGLIKGEDYIADETDLADISQNADCRERYQEGLTALKAKQHEAAIKHFQTLAEAEPQNALLNRCAAQAHVEFMLEHGWDIGYIARAKRFTARAKHLRPRHSQIRALENLIKQLDEDEAEVTQSA